jgi:molecular chaperone DnaK
VTAKRFVGIDLGTSNSAAAVFDGDTIIDVRTSQGGVLTPSIVHIGAKGKITVGEKARRLLEQSPDDGAAEFKRLMGTGRPVRFASAGIDKRPEELSALVLESIRSDIKEQLGFMPERAVISVPALFELPQSGATAEAARLAGFERVELLQEPIASALAAGWTQADSGGSWLVYDLGGGTFDASLLETRDGLLRVVGHDGDNFLGGRDFDRRVVEWAIERLGGALSLAEPGHAAAIRKLRRAAEEAKIELSRREEASITIPELGAGGRSIEVDLTLTRPELEELCAPLIDRTIEVCRRLLASKGVTPSSLSHIVLVGGPTIMPFLRERVGDALETGFGEGLDPMTLVARGAAIYAVTANLDAAPRALVHRPRARRLWLQYPAMSSDLLPHVVGKVAEGDGEAPARIRLERGDWSSAETEVEEGGGFVLSVELLPRRSNVFRFRATSVHGDEVAVDPETLTIVQGLTIGDPPLSRSIGVALANDAVQVYFERGTPLPARRTFLHNTVESVVRGSDECVLFVPIVQGELESAHLCRLVGTLEIRGAELSGTLPAGSQVEVTIELDRGGRMSARALVPSVNQVFEEVAELLVPEASVDVLEASIAELRERIAEMRSGSFRSGSTAILAALNPLDRGLGEVAKDIDAAKGGDADAAQKARRALIELDAQLEAIEIQKRWPELEHEARDRLAWASRWIAELGTRPERELFEELQDSVRLAREHEDPIDLQRHMRIVRQLGWAAFYRHPEAWEWMFESAASEVDRAIDLPRAQILVRRGRDAIGRGDRMELQSIVKEIWKLLPADATARRMSFNSGVK